MFASVHHYHGSPGLADRLFSSFDEIEKAMRITPGFIAYYVMKTREGATTLTFGSGKSDVEDSNRITSNWIRHNMPLVILRPPEFQIGEIVVATFGKTKVRV